jgi:hypothetical protein
MVLGDMELCEELRPEAGGGPSMRPPMESILTAAPVSGGREGSARPMRRKSWIRRQATAVPMPSRPTDSLVLPSPSATATWRDWLARLLPAPVGIDGRELARAVTGAALGVLFVALVCRWVGGAADPHAWLVAPLGAAAVLVFAVPASPLAQPWAVVAGNTLSALIGIGCAANIPDPVARPRWRWRWPSPPWSGCAACTRPAAPRPC